MHPLLAQLTPLIAAVACIVLLIAWRRSLRISEVSDRRPEAHTVELSLKSIAATEEWEVKITELGREQCGRIDTKLKVLQLLLEDAKKTSAELQAFIQHAERLQRESAHNCVS